MQKMNAALTYAADRRDNMVGYVANHGFSHDEAEDVVQETMLSVFQADALVTAPAGYWFTALRSRMAVFKRQQNKGHGRTAKAKDRLDCYLTVEIERVIPSAELAPHDRYEVKEVLAEVQAILQATDRKYCRALARSLRGESLGNADRVRLMRLRQRLRAAVS